MAALSVLLLLCVSCGSVQTSPDSSPATGATVPGGDTYGPVPMMGSTTVAVGVFQGCRSDGVVECWGSNEHGQLGQGHTDEIDGTVVVQDLSGATAIASGDQHVCALVGSAGEVFCWGLNDDGQLGVGDFSDRSSARRVEGITGAVMITAGDFHSCAVVGPARDLWCWGMNMSGQLGTARSDGGLAVPRKLSGFSGVVSVDAGFQHTCAALDDGSVKCLGDDTGGQAGGAVQDSAVAVEGVGDAVEVRVGMYQSCARVRSGEVRCWGSNSDGQFGPESQGSSSPVAIAVPALGRADAIAVGMKHVCSLVDGSVGCLGARTDDGSGGAIDYGKPEPMPDLKRVASIDADYDEICAVHTDGSVGCWNYERGADLRTR